MFFLHSKTIRPISRNQYDVIWYYLFKNLKDDWKSYLTVGAWLAVALWLQWVKKKNLPKFSTKQSWKLRGHSPNDLDSPHTQQNTMKSVHEWSCTTQSGFAIWYWCLVRLYCISGDFTYCGVKLFSCLAVSLHNHPAWKRRLQGWGFFYWVELDMILKWWAGLQLIFLVLSSDKMPSSNATDNVKHDLIEDYINYCC